MGSGVKEGGIREYLERSGINVDWHRLGLVTGLSPASSKEYYWRICEEIRKSHAGNNCPEFSIDNVNFGLVEALMELGEWYYVEGYITESMWRLERSGAEAIAICSNTIHRVLDRIENAIQIPIIHIGDCVADAISDRGLRRVGFLGTEFSMLEDFMIKRLEKSGAKVISPIEERHQQINRIIFDELCKGEITTKSRKFLLNVVREMILMFDIQGVVLGCTELPLSIRPEDQALFALNYKTERGRDFYFFDSEKLHIAALTRFCQSGELPETWT